MKQDFLLEWYEVQILLSVKINMLNYKPLQNVKNGFL